MSPIAFILGAGAHVGLAIANKFKQEEYRVAVGSRKPLQQEGLAPITVDVSNANSVAKAFAEVREKLGSAPNIVIFNAYALTFLTVPGDPYIVKLSAVKASLPAHSSVPKTFIFTRNMLPFLPHYASWSVYLNLGLQKVDEAYLTEIFHIAHEKEGFRFYYGDESKPDGSPAGEDWSGTAHAAAYWNAVSREERGNWYLRFGPDGELLPQ